MIVNRIYVRLDESDLNTDGLTLPLPRAGLVSSSKIARRDWTWPFDAYCVEVGGNESRALP